MNAAWETLKGNDPVKKRLKSMAQSGRIPSSLLFTGPQEIEKAAFARLFAADLVGGPAPHPDIHIYQPAGKLGLYPIDEMRKLAEELWLPPYQSGRKVFILEEADRMLSYSAHALLKAFEEPPPASIIILISSFPENLLPTILSRCIQIRFRALGRQQEEEVNSPLVDLISDLLAAPFGGHYKHLKAHIQKITDHLESVKQTKEEAAKQELSKLSGEQLSPQQKEAFEKELEGVGALALAQEFKNILRYILYWYRDLHLLRLSPNGRSPYLLYQKHLDRLEQQLQAGQTLDFNTAQKLVQEALLSFQRSTPPARCLETLLLAQG